MMNEKHDVEITALRVFERAAGLPTTYQKRPDIIVSHTMMADLKDIWPDFPFELHGVRESCHLCPAAKNEEKPMDFSGWLQLSLLASGCLFALAAVVCWGWILVHPVIELLRF